MFEIIQYNNKELLGKATTTYKKKEIPTLEIYFCRGVAPIVWVAIQEGIKTQFCNQLVDQLFTQLAAKGTIRDILVMDSVYKTQYSTTDTGSYQGENTLKWYKTTSCDKNSAFGLLMRMYEPAGSLNIKSGFASAVMVEAEAKGFIAFYLLSIIDSHFVTSETLQVFTDIVNGFLGMNLLMRGIDHSPGFKEVLTKYNARSHNIYN